MPQPLRLPENCPDNDCHDNKGGNCECHDDYDEEEDRYDHMRRVFSCRDDCPPCLSRMCYCDGDRYCNCFLK